MCTHILPAAGDSSAARHAMDVVITGMASRLHCELATTVAHAHCDPSMPNCVPVLVRR